MRDKEALLAQVTSLHEAASDAKRQLEESLRMYKENNSRLQEKLKVSSAEITKGNTIIHKLQSDGRALRSKLRLKAAVLLQQQELAAQEHASSEASEHRAAELRTACADLRAERDRAEESGGSLKTQLTEAHELLRSNQQVIQWLNKELNEAQRGGRPYVSVPSRVASFKPALHPSLKASVHPCASSAAHPAAPPAAVLSATGSSTLSSDATASFDRCW